MHTLVIATRGSQLALWQAEHIKAWLLSQRPHVRVELLTIKTKGDILLDVPLAKVGGKGLFVKEIEEALLCGSAHLAVHSMKDVPMLLPEGLILGALPQREVCTDVFLSEHYPNLAALPSNAILGTSSLRRQAQVLAQRPDLRVNMLRGNVETRLRKMKTGEYDAIILASAALKRLNLSASFAHELAPPDFLPAVGQGALGVEINAHSPHAAELMALLAPLDHPETRLCVEAERAFLAGLNGGCQVPIAGHATLNFSGPQATEPHSTGQNSTGITLEGMVAEPDGSLLLRKSLHCAWTTTPQADFAAQRRQAADLGHALAEELLAAGADNILKKLYEGQA